MSKVVVALAAFALCLGSTSPVLAASSAEGDRARQWVRGGLQAMGGEARLRALGSVRLEGIAHHYHLEQSERPEGPFIGTFKQLVELKDLKGGRLHIESESRGSFFEAWQKSALTYAQGTVAMQRADRMMPGRPEQVVELEEHLALSPERVLLTALEAGDLKAQPDTVFQGVAHHAVTFTWKGMPVKVLLNAYSGLPTAVERVGDSGDVFWGVWGDVRSRTLFGSWGLEAGGVRYPRQWTLERNGTTEEDLVITGVGLDVPVEEASFQVPEDVKKGFEAALAKGPRKPQLGQMGEAHELAPGVWFFPGFWNTALVRQTDGLVVLEAPISSDYSAQVMAEARRRFPGVPIKAVISTSDAFPHIGGVREWVAAGLPVYALDLNRPLLERLVAAPHTLAPDTLAKAPRKPRFQTVGGKVVLGSGANRLELYPVRGESSERMVMVYFPEHHLLYGSDLIQRMPDGKFFAPQYLTELSDAVEREGLRVERAFAMHSDALDWNLIRQAASEALVVQDAK